MEHTVTPQVHLVAVQYQTRLHGLGGQAAWLTGLLVLVGLFFHLPRLETLPLRWP